MNRVKARALMALVLLVCLAGCRSMHAGEPARKPVLDVWTCNTDDDQRLAACWQENATFRETVKACYEVRWWPVGRYPAYAAAHGIVRGPTFILDGRRIGQGFDTSDALLVGLGLKVPAKAPSQNVPPPSQISPPPSQTDAPPFQPQPPPPDLEKFRQELLGEVRSLLRSVNAESDPRLVSQLQALNTRLTMTDSYRLQLEEMRVRYGGVATTLQALQQQLATRPAAAPVNQAPAPVEPAKNDDSLRPSFWARSVRVFGFTLTIAQWLGATTITGGSFPVVYFLLRGLGFFAARRSSAGGTPQNPAPSTVPAQCGQCLRQMGEIDRLRRECEALRHAQQLGPTLAPYETSKFRTAFEEACASTVKRYPGSDSTLETLRSILSQILSSKGEKL